MANGKSNVNVKIDSEVKERATILLERMGLDQTTAIDMFYRQIIVERRLPFQPVAIPTINEQIIAAALNNNSKSKGRSDVLRDIAVGEPVFLTKNGRGRYVVVDMQKYEKTQSTIKLFGTNLETEI